ncbi:MAG: hypothetical protein GY696_02125 [Gammaproteobacteria bacterium]|nr:hypothetical protein [Gammaproteobacteria bacterium]
MAGEGAAAGGTELDLGVGSFEDKRKENFDRGHTELMRRRQLLQEQETREKDERQRKEKMEFEKQEREHEIGKEKVVGAEQIIAKQMELD